MGINQHTGNLGYGIAGCTGQEANLFEFWIPHGMLVGAPTTPSSQASGTGASDFNVNIAAGILICQGQIQEKALQADFDLASSAAAQMAAGESRVYSIIVYRSLGNGELYWKVVAGAAAVTGSEEAPSVANIEADLAQDTPWMHVANVTVNRTGDTTVTQSYDNTVRPLLRQKRVQFP